jgi:hypothetical protein
MLSYLSVSDRGACTGRARQHLVNISAASTTIHCRCHPIYPANNLLAMDHQNMLAPRRSPKQANKSLASRNLVLCRFDNELDLDYRACQIRGVAFGFVLAARSPTSYNDDC